VDKWKFNVMKRVHEGKAISIKAIEYYGDLGVKMKKIT